MHNDVVDLGVAGECAWECVVDATDPDTRDSGVVWCVWGVRTAIIL